jgi:glycosyltransferase involved in cell wall biosynthesis
MKIVYIINSLGNSGGMERVLSTKANFLATQLGNTVYIITQFPLPSDKFFHFSPLVKIESLDMPRPSGNKFKNIISAPSKKRVYKHKLAQRLKEICADIAISMCGNEFSFLHQIKDGSHKIAEFHFSKNYLVQLVKNIPGLKLRAFRLLMVKWMQFMQHKKNGHYEKLILLTDADKNLWGNQPYMCVIPNPLSYTYDGLATLGNPQIIAIGRLIAQKGFDLLIESFSLVSAKFQGWNLVIVGEGQDEAYLKNLIAKKQLTGRITLQPPVKNIQNLLLDSSILAFPSRYEGFGLVLTEAMECGLPCVAFDCECGPAEIIKNGEDGLLVANGNVTEFAASLEKLMSDKDLRKRMGSHAKVNVKRFHAEHIMPRWVRLFTQLAG